MTDPVPAPTANAPSTSWLPSRKIISGGIAGILTWFLVYLANKYLNWTIPPDVQSEITSAITLITVYLVPSTVQEVVNHLNDAIIKVAAADPNSAVSERTVVLPPATKIVSVATPGPIVAVPPALDPAIKKAV